MAVTVNGEHDDVSADEPDDLDGHTIEQLADYLDAGRRPVDESIEASAACRHALAALARLRAVTEQVRQDPGPADPDDAQWVTGMIARIATDARPGRDIALEHRGGRPRVLITEGAVKALIRATGDGVPSMLVGRVDLDGDFTRVDAPLTVTVGVTILYGADIPAAAASFRTAVFAALTRHIARLALVLNVTVQDLQAPTRAFKS